MDKQKPKVLIWDTGLSLEHAIKLSEKFQVLYFTPWVEAFPKFESFAPGVGMEGINKVLNYFDHIEEADWFMFPDIGAGDLCAYLKKTTNKPVYGAGKGEILEENREAARQWQRRLGLKTQATKLVTGISELRKELKKSGHCYVKLDIFRGDIDSFEVENVDSVEQTLDRIANVFGPFKEKYNFIIEDYIEGLEPGLDLFFNGQRFLQPYLWGFEHAKGPYCGVYTNQLPFVFQKVLDKLTPLLRKLDYRGAISLEFRVPNKNDAYIIDFCCYDEKTEILTDKGWKYFKDLKGEEKVMTLNPETNEIEYQLPSKYLSYFVDGKMVKINNTSIDLLVTPNHRQWIIKQNKKKGELVRADKIPQGARIPRTGKWIGKKIEYFTLPSYTNIWHSGKGRGVDRIKYLSPLNIKIENWLKFLGIYLAEGSRGGQGVINISQFAKNKEMADLLKDFPIEIKKTEKGFQLYSKQIDFYVKQFGRCNEKFVPQWLKELSSDLIEIFLNAFCLGDGSVRESNSRLFFTTSHKLADDIQELLLKVGSLGNIKTKKTKGTIMRIGKRKYIRRFDSYIIRERKIYQKFNIDNSRYNHCQEIQYKGLVYDVEVPKYHILYVRRNGKPIWSGNCRFPFPLSAVYTEALENYSEVIYQIARKRPILLKPKAKYVACLPLASNIAEKDWVKLDFPENMRNKIKFRVACNVDSKYYGVKGHEWVYVLITWGNNINQMIEELSKLADMVKAEGGLALDVIGGLNLIKEDIIKIQKLGIPFN